MSLPASQDALRLPQGASRVSRLVQHQATASRARYEITARSDAKLLTRKTPLLFLKFQDKAALRGLQHLDREVVRLAGLERLFHLFDAAELGDMDEALDLRVVGEAHERAEVRDAGDDAVHHLAHLVFREQFLHVLVRYLA